MHFHNCQFLESEGEVDLKKMSFASKKFGALIYDIMKIAK